MDIRTREMFTKRVQALIKAAKDAGKQMDVRLQICICILELEVGTRFNPALINALTKLDNSLSTTGARLGEIQKALNLTYGEGVANNPYIKEHADYSFTIMKKLSEVMTAAALDTLAYNSRNIDKTKGKAKKQAKDALLDTGFGTIKRLVPHKGKQLT